MKTIKLLATATLLALASSSAYAASFGFCTDEISRNNIFRLGDTEKQGLAIKLDSEKLSQLKGCTISSVSIAFGSKRTTGGTANIFITTALESTPLVSQTSTIPDVIKWSELALTTPYTITGNEQQLYIGYTAEISTRSSMLLSDMSSDTEGCTFFYRDGEWVDGFGLGFGSPSIRINVPDAPQITDLMIKPVDLRGYFNAGNSYNFKGQVFNFGTETINSFDICVNVGDQATVKNHVSGVTIEPNTVFDIALPACAASTEGALPLNVEITNVNGTTETATADNVYASSIFFYPTHMERALLLEGFTGQDCSQCPSGHANINTFLAGASVPVIEVMHHAGYQPDFMTMASDRDYTFFYGSSSTYAPAVMLNRMVVPGVGSVPVMNISGSTSQINTAYDAALATEPYVSLAIESTYDAATRKLDVNVRSLTHNNLPSEQNVLNVFLVQNGISAYQLPTGQGYTHNCVFRGTLTGNSWGLLLNDEATVSGGEANWSTSITLPQAIFSDYWNRDQMPDALLPNYNIATDPDNMYLVAYIGAYKDNDVSGHIIYNAVEAPLGGKYAQGGMASVDNITADASTTLNVRIVNRRIVVDGEYESVRAFTIDGRQVNANGQLTPGIYVVRATNGSHTAVKKFIVK